jgi:hypothetical protein
MSPPKLDPERQTQGESMPTQQTAADVLERHFLEIRCGLLNLAAALDRIERSDGAGDVRNDARLELIRRGVELLGSGGGDRAERLQMLFSDNYEEGWNR